jgi:hypothetical protein
MERKNKPEIEAAVPDESEEELFEFDLTTAFVEVVDGALVKNEDGTIKLLLYHIRPHFEGEVGRCRAVVEARLSQRRFLEVVDEMNRLAANLKHNEIGFDPMVT